MYYETIFIVNPDVSQSNVEELTNSLIERIEKAGGRVVKREYWGVRTLAYSIAKRKRGHYILLVVDGDSRAVSALERALSLDETILRFMTTRLTELSDEPSPLMRRRTTVKEKESAAPEPEPTEAEAGPEASAKPEKEEAITGGNEKAAETEGSQAVEKDASD
jgi:small subunit ribosomal protein S6